MFLEIDEVPLCDEVSGHDGFPCYLNGRHWLKGLQRSDQVTTSPCATGLESSAVTEAVAGNRPAGVQS